MWMLAKSRKARISGTIGTCTGSRKLPVAGQKGGPGLMLRRLVLAVALLSLVAIGAACTSSKPKASDSPTPTTSTSSTPTKSSASPSPSTTPTIDPQAQPAITAFKDYLTATFNSQMKPRQLGEKYSPTADFTKYSFDPMLGQENAYIGYLAQQGQAFKGTPPKPRITVSAINLAAKPYPTVVLSNCPTPSPSWVAYQVGTGKAVPYTQPKVKPPYRSEVVVIYYQSHWGVQKTTVDSSKTCAA